MIRPDLPAPPIPAECDLRGLPYMPVDVVALFDSDFFAISSGDGFKAAIALWGKSIYQTPAGSLPADERVLAALSYSQNNWGNVREDALYGWEQCSDGRLYHKVIAKFVREAWEGRCAQRARTAAARAVRAANRSDVGEAASSVTENVTASKLKYKLKKESKKDTELRSAPPMADAPADLFVDATFIEKDIQPEVAAGLRPSPANADAPTDARSQLWSDGLRQLRALTGRGDRTSRALLAKLLQASRDDCRVVMQALADAEDLRPLDSTSWLLAAVKPRNRKPESALMRMRRAIWEEEQAEREAAAAWQQPASPTLLGVSYDAR